MYNGLGQTATRQATLALTLNSDQKVQTTLLRMITNQAIKMFPNAAVDCLPEIFNACLQHQHSPKAWKEARVIVVPKAGKPLRDLANYHPISPQSGLSKLFEKLKFSSYLVNLLTIYLEECTFHVAMREECSTVCLILAGVPQGSILLLFLSNIFTNDIPKDLKKKDLALYADDIAVISQSFSEKEVEKNLESSLSKISGWYSDWRMIFNTSKSSATLFTRKQIKKHALIRLNGEEIKWESSSSYSGVTLDSKLSWRNHIKKTCQSAATKLAALYLLLRTKSMPMLSKVDEVTAMIRPTMTYASPVWSGCKPEYQKPLQTLQNKVLRIATGAPCFA
ncbi:hypothetical protein NDU88_004226 [Pleurodeles waltl]|uniref:Reverse transcriptase domain-containing protein n=1 Tax=Pleurodeles waltl TaxID=8319 RepID=A0AAV7TQW9_PLEWA|nr:hypothetical protein NDU88_004226 [Pleurodeles waltl]